MTTIIRRVVRARVAVTQMLAVAVPPMCRPVRSGVTAAKGTSPRRLSVRMKKKTLQMYLMKRSVCSPSAGWATSSRRYLQIASMPLAKPDEGTSRSISLTSRRRRKRRGRKSERRSPARMIMVI